MSAGFRWTYAFDQAERVAVGKITERSGRLLTERFVIDKIITKRLLSTGRPPTEHFGHQKSGPPFIAIHSGNAGTDAELVKAPRSQLPGPEVSLLTPRIYFTGQE